MQRDTFRIEYDEFRQPANSGDIVATTTEKAYTKRLVALQRKSWKSMTDVQRPYRWNLRRLKPGKTLDVGCGIGRSLAALPNGSIGIDHNPHSVDIVNRMGLVGFLPEDFRNSVHYIPGGYDSVLLCHVLEHMSQDEGTRLIKEYTPLVKLGGSAILICPQEKGFMIDDTHIAFLEIEALCSMLTIAGYTVEKTYSFPLPRIFGRIFTYNEFVVVGRKTLPG
jgi:2-polyprenyl-3-methyl-5-hydroxy-6-metoxy-1,4-benzoquinol methylase